MTILVAMGATAQEMPHPPVGRGQFMVAETVCGDRHFMRRLMARSGSLRSAALAGNGTLIERWQVADGSWVLLFSGTDGMACVVAAGESWEVIAAPAGSES